MDEFWIPKMCDRLVEIERETQEVLGIEAAFFIDVYNDCQTIQAALIDAYPSGREQSLVFLILTGLFKEIHWLHTLFAGGNYPLLNARLRFVWEFVYRATLAELDGPPTFADRIEWLRVQESKSKTRPGWDNCIEPLLGKLYPWQTDAEREHHIQDRKELWTELHEYVHPSVGLLVAMCESERPLLMADHFNELGAKRSLVNAQFVFDLVWLAVLGAFPNAVPIIKVATLKVPYPLVQSLLAR